jgi:hypothetical protein
LLGRGDPTEAEPDCDFGSSRIKAAGSRFASIE